jgi:hypothetical protein
LLRRYRALSEISNHPGEVNMISINSAAPPAAFCTWALRSVMKARLVVAILALGAVQAWANVIVPSAETSVEGNSNNSFPFNIAAFALSSQRYQQVYGSSEFSGPFLITDIEFRPDAFTGAAFSSTLSSIQIDLSTTAAAVDGLSSTFAANVGSNDTVVFSGPLTLSSSDTGPAGGPKTFDIVIVLQTPFLYDPALGNLLLDVRNFGGGFTTSFDAQSTIGDSVSRVFSLTGASSPTGNTDTLGLITSFSGSAVPEPGTLALVGLGAAGLAWRRRKS